MMRRKGLKLPDRWDRFGTTWRRRSRIWLEELLRMKE